MKTKRLGLLLFGAISLTCYFAEAESVSREVCSSSMATELNQSLRVEAEELKSFLETRNRRTLSGRDKIEACSRWSVMGSYAKGMTKFIDSNFQSRPAASMVEHLQGEIDGNNDCWVKASPQVASMLEGVRIILSRTKRLGALLSDQGPDDAERDE